MVKSPGPRKPKAGKTAGKRPGRPSRPKPGAADTGAFADGDGPVVIRKYANRRLYNTDTASFVTLDDLRQMVYEEAPFIVVDAKTDRDITSSLLAQIIADQETRGENMLPNDVLRQIIGFYEKGMTESVSTYLQKSMNAFTDQWQQAEQLGEIGRRNIELFQQNLSSMFKQATDATVPQPKPDEKTPQQEEDDQVSALQEQLRKIQEKLDALKKEN
tara:strand:+ start:660 stop:1307 length:648 start_codon:yes stop_codon:yes gene_type:complete